MKVILKVRLIYLCFAKCELEKRSGRCITFVIFVKLLELVVRITIITLYKSVGVEFDI